jgi:hypothetical protein
LPVHITAPGLFGKDELLWVSFRTLPLPASNSCIAASRRRAFAGLRRRYAVSSSALKSSSASMTTDCPPLRVMIKGSWSSHTRSIVLAKLARAEV